LNPILHKIPITLYHKVNSNTFIQKDSISCVRFEDNLVYVTLQNGNIEALPYQDSFRRDIEDAEYAKFVKAVVVNDLNQPDFFQELLKLWKDGKLKPNE